MPNIMRRSRVKRSSKRANDFTSSIRFDAPIARHVVKINMAHMISLLRSREVSTETGTAILGFLVKFQPERELDPGTEDVHHMIEQEAIEVVGMDKAGYLNLGKSRNDQVATALRMEVRERILSLAGGIARLQQSLVHLMKRYGSLAMPGYTHLQRAQPITVAHDLQAYFDGLQRDVERLQQAYGRVNLSPMGAAALAGTSLNVDRKLVASLLGFDGLIENAMDAVSSRDFALEVLACCELVMVDLSRLAEELIIWSSSEFGFVEIDDAYSATSSIMPQKKNPVVAETVRAKCGTVIGASTAAFAIAKALPNSYNLDLQEVTPRLWEALSDTTASVVIMGEMLASMRFNPSGLAKALSDDKSAATELANFLVRAYSLPFREAHAVVGELVSISLKGNRTLAETSLERMPEVSRRITGRAVKLDKGQLKGVLDALKTLKVIRSAGGANPRYIGRQILRSSRSTQRTLSWTSEKTASLKKSTEKLRLEAGRPQIEVRR